MVKTTMVRSIAWLIPMRNFILQEYQTGQESLYSISRWQSPVRKLIQMLQIGAPHIGFGGALGTGGWGFYQPSYDWLILTSLTQIRFCLKVGWLLSEGCATDYN